ncbi:MAG: urease accessory protein UreD, partial [Pseudomonadota bacterium]
MRASMAAVRRADSVDLERARGTLRLRVSQAEGANRVAELGQSGCARLLFPAIAKGATLEAVIVNTAGGLTGGDRFASHVTVDAGSRAVVTTQACERLYRAVDGAAQVDTRLDIGAGADLAWLPQETILFNRSALTRSLRVEMAGDARFLALEAVLLGRRASGEVMTEMTVRDSWRIIRDGRLVFAEETALGPDPADALAARATLNGASAFATILFAAPDAEARVEALRGLPTIEAC